MASVFVYTAITIAILHKQIFGCILCRNLALVPHSVLITSLNKRIHKFITLLIEEIISQSEIKLSRQ